jgi:hypothetical protein
MMSKLVVLAADIPLSNNGPGVAEWIAMLVFGGAVGLGVAVAIIFLKDVGKAAGDWREGIREWLAIAIVGVGILIVGVLGTFAMLMADDDTFRDKVVSAIFPLLGAWVGAVIAYYFAKENLEAAAKSTKELLNLDERLRKTTVAEVMISFGEMVGKEQLADMQAATSLNILDFQKRMLRNRTPVFDGSGRALLIVHKSTLAEYISGKVGTPNIDPAALTLGDLEGETEDWAQKLWNKLKAFATVGPKASLADVKEAMTAKGPDCADVFVTQDGTPGTAVVGWVTNADLGRASKA